MQYRQQINGIRFSPSPPRIEIIKFFSRILYTKESEEEEKEKEEGDENT